MVLRPDLFIATASVSLNSWSDFISFHLLTYIISDIELRFGGKFQIRENDWTKFAEKMDKIHDTLHSSNELYSLSVISNPEPSSNT